MHRYEVPPQYRITVVIPHGRIQIKPRDNLIKWKLLWLFLPGAFDGVRG